MTLLNDIIHDTSNRGKHFCGGMFCGFCATVIFAVGVATGMEFKDCQQTHCWDWGDWLATTIGGLIGNLISATWVWLIWTQT